MHRAAAAVAVALALPAAARAEVAITAAGDRLDVSAARAPVSEVLDGLARKTRMKVVYDGAAPRTPVTVELRGRTPAEAVLGVLDGLGLSYALVLDPSGREVETLMIVGSGPRPASGGVALGPAHGPRESAHAIPDAPEVESEEPTEEVSAPEPEVQKSDENEKKDSSVGPLNPAGSFPVSPFAPAPTPTPIPIPTPSPSPHPPSGG